MVDEFISSVLESVGDLFTDSTSDTIEAINETVDKESLITTEKSIASGAPDILYNAIPDPSAYCGNSTKKATEDQPDSQE